MTEDKSVPKSKVLAAHLNALPIPLTVAEVDVQREQILKWKLENEAELDDIRQQIDEAKSQAYHEGEYSDPDWFHRAQHALRSRKRLAQQIQGCLTKLKRLRQECYKKEAPVQQGQSLVVRLGGDATPEELWEAARELLEGADPRNHVFRLKLIE